MADVKFEVVQFELSTTVSSTQDVTISGFGTPKAAMFFMNEAQALNTTIDDMRLSIGFTDGTNQSSVCVHQNHNAAKGDCGRRHDVDSVVLSCNTAGDQNAKYGFNQWITDGVRLDCDDPIGSGADGRYCVCVLIGGSDVSNVYVGSYDDLGTGTSAVDITQVGFESDLVFTAIHHSPTAAPSGSVHSIMSFGIGLNDGSDTQRSIMFGARDASATTINCALISNTYIMGQVYNDAIQWQGSIGSYDSSGFSITPTVSAESDIFHMFCIKFTGSPDLALFDMSYPTSGDYAETTPGFEPSFGLIHSLRNATARDSLKTSDVYGVSTVLFDDTNIYTVSMADEDGSARTDASSRISDSLYCLEDSGGASVVGTFDGFDADGWDFSLTTNPSSNAHLGFGLAIGPGAAAGGRIMSSLAYHGGLAGKGGIAGQGGGLAG